MKWKFSGPTEIFWPNCQIFSLVCTVPIGPQIQTGLQSDCSVILFILLLAPDHSEHGQDESLRAKSYPVATDEIHRTQSETLIPDSTEVKHPEMLYSSNSFCFLL